MGIAQTTSPTAPVVSRYKERSYDGDYMKAGRLAERIVMDWLVNHPEVVEVDDLSHLRQLQRVDSDCAVCLRDGTTPLAEIKWDRWLGIKGNVLVEVLRLNHKGPSEVAGVLGWTLRTPARWILYYAPNLAQVYQFQTEQLRQSLQRYTEEMREKTRFSWVCTDRIKSARNSLVPVAYCEGAFRVHDVLKYAERYAPDSIPEVMQLRLRYFAGESLQWS